MSVTSTNTETLHVLERAARTSLLFTTINVIIKLIAGFISGSVSVLAEGMQSSVDVLISFGVLKAIQVSAQPADTSHPYGHGKAQVLLAAGQMMLIIVTSLIIVAQATRRLIHPEAIEVDWGLAAMLISTIINLGVSTHLARLAEKHKSAALKSEVAHLRGDLLSSVGILVGLITVWLTGWKALDPIVAVAFMIYVMASAHRELRALIHPLMDGSLPPEEVAAIERVLTTHPESRGFHALKTRAVGSDRMVDLHVLLDDHLSFVEAHARAEEIEEEISKALGGAIVNVHYEPAEAEKEHQRLAHQDQSPN